MTINLNQEVSVELDPEYLERAGAELRRIRNNPADIDLVLDALFVLLAFRQLEKSKPGSMAKIQKTINASLGRAV